MSDPAMRQRQAALGYRIAMFGGMWILAAMLIAVLQQPHDMVASQAASLAQTQAADTGRGWTQSMWDWLPLWTGFLGLIMLVSGAAIEKRRVP